MKHAIVTIKRTIKIDKEETDDILKEIFEVVKKFFSTNSPIKSLKEIEVDFRTQAIARVNQIIKPDIKKYIENFTSQVVFESYTFSEVTTYKNAPELTRVEVEIISSKYTILDSTGNFILLKEGDLRDVLKQNEPIIADAFFLELTPEIAYKTYICNRQLQLHNFRRISLQSFRQQ